MQESMKHCLIFTVLAAFMYAESACSSINPTPEIGPDCPDSATEISCSATVKGSPSVFSDDVTEVRCPSNCGNSGSVWGTEIYTHDSVVCKAAVHARKIEASEGGIIYVKNLPGQSSYTGSTANGVTTTSYGAWGASYRFCDTMECLEDDSDSTNEISCSATVKGSPSVFSDDVTEVRCPSNCGNSGSVWGTKIYTHDSVVCKAAVHAGKIEASEGGIIYVKNLPGQSSYTSSTANGVTTTSYGAWGASYRFCDTMECLEDDSDSTTEISCSATVKGSPSVFSDDVTEVRCPSNCGNSGRVWGTEIYTHDSVVCKAAVHAGKIEASEGGIIYVKNLPGQSSYMGTTANGVTTSSYGAWGASFTFCDK